MDNDTTTSSSYYDEEDVGKMTTAQEHGRRCAVLVTVPIHQYTDTKNSPKL